MTFEEYHEINRKYGCKIMPFDINLDKFTKEEYEEHVKHLAEVIDDIFKNAPDYEEDDF